MSARQSGNRNDAPSIPRRRREVSAATVLAVTAGLLVAVPLTAAAETIDHQAAVQAGDAKNAGQVQDPRPAEVAIAEAVKTGKDVPIPSLTDEFSTTVATASGKLRREQHRDAQRTKRSDGSWTALDGTLTKRADGSFAPAASSESLVISGGGSGPLATMTTRDGKQLVVSSPFPGALPAPTVSGSSALYASVAPDTDLKVTATKYGGYSTVLILHTPAAAANPAVKSLTFPTMAKGLQLSTNPDGSLKAVSDGQEVFTAPKPQMWSAGAPATAAAGGPEAATTAALKSTFTMQGAVTPAADPTAESPDAPSTADGPAAGATVADIPVTASTNASGSGSIQLAPSPDLLDGAATTFPVYVDPSWSYDARGKSNHAWVQSAYPTVGNFNRTGSTAQDHPGVGFQGWETKTGVERALYEFNLNGYLPDTRISYANLRVSQFKSSDYSCTTTYPVTLYRADPFDGTISWNSHRMHEWIEQKQVPGNGTNSACMGSIPLDFNVTAQMRNALANTGVPLAFALAGKEGAGDRMGFKRFDYDAVLSTEFDHVPLQPTDPRTSPAPRSVTRGESDSCGDVPVSSYRWITDTTVNLTSVVSSHNQPQLTEYVSLWDNAASGNPVVNAGWSGFVPNGSRASYTVPRGTLQDGHYYGWNTQGDDGLLRGPATAVCHFAVDTTPPVAAFGTFTDPNTQFPPSGNGQTTNLRLGQQGSIPFTAYDPNPSGLLASGVVCVRYGYDPQLIQHDQYCSPAGSTLNVAEIKTTPPHWGTNILYARVFDDAANSSQTVSYSFYVPWAPGPVAFGDTTGDANPDVLVPDTAGNLITHGRATNPGNPDVPPTGSAADANQSPEAAEGRTWKDFRITHRGSLDPGKNTDNLFVHRPGGDKLYYYANDEANPGHFSLNLRHTLTRPNCEGDDLEISCPGYHQDEPSWQYTSQITPIGSASDTRTPNRVMKDATGVFAVESGNLWYYPAKSSTRLRAPNLVATGGWDNLDLMVPGNTLAIDPTNSSAATPALWARVRTTSGSHSAGDILQYAITTKTSTDGLGDYTTVTSVTPASAFRIGAGVTTDIYPTVGADGDQTGDKVPDLWALDSSGKLHTWPATVAGTSVTSFNGDHYRGNTQAPTVQWKLNGDTTANPSTYEATAGDLTFADDTVDGRATKVAVFNGSTSAATTNKPVIDTRQSFTISTWAKSTGTGNVIASQNTTRASSFILWSEGPGGAWRFALAHADNDNWPYDYTSTTNSAALVQTGVWTQLTASYNAATGQMSLYVNGTLAGTAHHRASTSPAPTGNLVLGRYQYQGQQTTSFNGSVSNFAVYNTAVNPPPVVTAIRHAASENCLDVPNNDTNQGIWLIPCNNTEAQKLTVNPTDGSISLRGKCLDITGGGTTSGTPVGLWTCAGAGGNQTWLLQANGTLYSPYAGRCLDLPNNDTTPGTRLVIHDCNATPAQTWSIPALKTPALPFNP